MRRWKEGIHARLSGLAASHVKDLRGEGLVGLPDGEEVEALLKA